MMTDQTLRRDSYSFAQELCAGCAQWDFSKLFVGVVHDAKSTGPLKSVERKDNDVWDIRPLSEVLSAQNCPVCCLVIQILRRRGPLESALEHADDLSILELKVEYRKHDISIWFLALRIGIAPLTRIFAGASELTMEDEKEILTILPGQNFLVVDGKPLARYAGREVTPYCDYALINSWLGRCARDALHGSCQRGRFSRSTITKLSFIDIKNSCIRIADLPQKYAALSYVWGVETVPQLKLTTENLSELSAPQALTKAWSQVPTTIRDAIAVCQSCDIPFLWVDALCVVQDGPTLRDELEKMTEIYSSAFVSIIAAYGQNSWSGLRGVSSPRNFKQAKAHFDQISLVEGLTPLSVELDQSKWPHRAWTFQEHLFSRRCLIFLEHRIIFQCHLEWLDESIIKPTLLKLDTPRKAPRIRLYDKFENGFASHDFQGQSPATADQRFLNFVETYFSLDLTLDSDILNACRGTMNWCRVEYDISFFWATPTTDLFLGLMFQLKNSRRREEMPSWSWVGWRKYNATEARTIHFDMRDSTGSEIRSDVHFYRFSPLLQGKSGSGLQLVNPKAEQAGWQQWIATQLLMLSDTVKGLTTTEMEKLLVFKAPAQRIYLGKDEEYLTKAIQAVVNSEITVPCVELVEIGGDWEKGYVKRHSQMVLKNTICLIIKTSARGISERIGIVKFWIKRWRELKPEKRWVFLV